MIKNIVFDVGRVLVSFEPVQYLAQIGFDEVTRKHILEAMFENGRWLEGDRGVLSIEELLECYIANAPTYKNEITEAFRRIGEAIEVLPHTMKWLADLKARGYRLFVISNYGEYTYVQTKEKLTFLQYMEGSLFSYRYKIVKPEPEIYEMLLDDYHLKAEECVFIDDSLVNVEGATAVGYQAIQFHNYEQAKEELERLLT